MEIFLIDANIKLRGIKFHQHISHSDYFLASQSLPVCWNIPACPVLNKKDRPLTKHGWKNKKQRENSRGLTDEAVAPLLLQHLADVAHAADRELIVVELVPRRGSGVHDVVALLLLVLALRLSRGALGSRVMLSDTKKRGVRVVGEEVVGGIEADRNKRVGAS